MPEMTFKGPQGQITINSPDGSTPSEAELDSFFAKKYGEPSPKASGEIFGSLEENVNAVASGLVKGGEGMLVAGQGVMNVAGDVASAVGLMPKDSMPQFLGKMAGEAEIARKALLGEQHSLSGKVIEIVSSIPSVMAMTMGGGASGMAIGAAKFAGLSALQARGQEEKLNLGNIAIASGKGFAQGLALGKAASMGTISGTALSGGVSAAIAAMEGGDANDVLAGALTGAGLNVMSKADHLAKILTAPVEGVKNTAQAISNVAERMAVDKTDPLSAAISIGKDKLSAVVDDIVKVGDSPTRIHELEQATKESKSLIQEQQAQFKLGKTDAEVNLDRTKKYIESQRQAGLTDIERSKQTQIFEAENSASELAKKFDQITYDAVVDLKNGKLKQIGENTSKAYDSHIEGMDKAIEAKGGLTRLDEIDMYAKILDSLPKTPGLPDSAILSNIKATLSFLKSEKNTKFRTGSSGITQSDVMSLLAKGGTINGQKAPVAPELSDKVYLGDVIKRSREVRDAVGYGSHEADVVRLALGDLVEKKLGSPEFSELQRSMSSAISFKNKASQIFNLAGGDGYTQSGMDFLQRVATGRSSMDDQNLIKYIENGPILKGLQVEGAGNIMGAINEVGSKFVDIATKLGKVGKFEKSAVGSIMAEHTARLQAAEAQGRMSKDLADKEFDLVIEKLKQQRDSMITSHEKAIAENEGNLKVQKELQAKMQDTSKFINSMGYAAYMINGKFGAFLKFAGHLMSAKANSRAGTYKKN